MHQPVKPIIPKPTHYPPAWSYHCVRTPLFRSTADYDVDSTLDSPLLRAYEAALEADDE